MANGALDELRSSTTLEEFFLNVVGSPNSKPSRELSWLG